MKPAERQQSRQQSRQLQAQAERCFPGGVNSPVRAFQAVGGQPPFVVRAEGAQIFDADGNAYLDYVGSWGPMILGHAFPPAVEAICEAAGRSASFGASCEAEQQLAALVQRAFPSIEKMRFVSSGTEAAMSAIRVARAATGRSFFIKFEGCYHGHADMLLVKAGSGVATLGIPGSAGVPAETVQHTLALPYNSLDAVERAFAAHNGEIACIILEPVAGNMGCVPPAENFLSCLREICTREGALLIFDEVMTGFRVALGGAQQLYGTRPDLTCLGKIVGGGLPCGVFGGAQEFMDLLAPLGPVYQAGTLSGNPLAMAAGRATLEYLFTHGDEIYPRLDKLSDALVAGVLASARSANIPMTANRVGSMFTWFFTESTVTDFASASTSDLARFAIFHNGMMERGVWLPPSQFEAAFLSAAHTEHDVARTIEAAAEALA
jgi:glutamate-1-semialdehyde 2,1-aminomutase